MAVRLVIVGGGPRAAGLIERIAANADLLDRPLEVHVVDPFPSGGGRVWRHAQSPLLRMNSMAEDVTMFTDDSVTCTGPVRPGPSLWEWAALAPDLDLDPEVRAELAAMVSTSFPSRRVQSAYLGWFFAEAVRSLPAGVTVRTHRALVSRVAGGRVVLDSSVELRADVVVLALGHLDTVMAPEHAALAGYAERHGLSYLPPAYSADVDLDGFAPGSDVVLRGFGLAAVDLVVLLTEGRGGRFVDGPDGKVYLPSGREPRLHVGSRRGVPYHSKTSYRLRGPVPPLPRFFDDVAADALIARESLSFRDDVWPLLAKEIAWGHYHELFTGHPERVRLPWPEFADRYARLDFFSAEMSTLVDEAVLAPDDRVDFDRLDRPLAGLSFTSAEEFQEYLRDYIVDDVRRRSDQRYSADLGAFMALLSVFGQFPRVLAAPGFDPGSRREDGDGWWFGFFSYLASGPPPDRLVEMLALSRAGVLNFVGPDMRVRPEDGVFLVDSPAVPGVVRATGLIEARLPTHRVADTADPMLRALADSGEVAEEVLSDGGSTGQLLVSAEDGRVIGRNGKAHPYLFAVGPYTSGRAFAAFSRPNTNAPAFRQNDVVARAVLQTLAAIGAERGVA